MAEPPPAGLQAGLFAEAAALDRLLYRNRRQHRGARHLRRLLGVRRAARRLHAAWLQRRAAAGPPRLRAQVALCQELDRALRAVVHAAGPLTLLLAQVRPPAPPPEPEPEPEPPRRS